MKQVLIILRGAPASGKSTIGSTLRDFDNKIVWLKTDNFKPFFINTGEFTDIMSKTALSSLNLLLEEGFSVIYEGIFQNPLFVKNAIILGKNKKIPVYVYELNCSLATLQNRDINRNGVKEGYRKPLGNNVIEKIYNSIIKSPIENAIKLNTENQSIEKCVQIIKKYSM